MPDAGAELVYVRLGRRRPHVTRSALLHALWPNDAEPACDVVPSTQYKVYYQAHCGTAANTVITRN